MSKTASIGNVVMREVDKWFHELIDAQELAEERVVVEQEITINDDGRVIARELLRRGCSVTDRVDDSIDLVKAIDYDNITVPLLVLRDELLPAWSNYKNRLVECSARYFKDHSTRNPRFREQYFERLPWQDLFGETFNKFIGTSFDREFRLLRNIVLHLATLPLQKHMYDAPPLTNLAAPLTYTSAQLRVARAESLRCLRERVGSVTEMIIEAELASKTVRDKMKDLQDLHVQWKEALGSMPKFDRMTLKQDRETDGIIKYSDSMNGNLKRILDTALDKNTVLIDIINLVHTSYRSEMGKMLLAFEAYVKDGPRQEFASATRALARCHFMSVYIGKLKVVADSLRKKSETVGFAALDIVKELESKLTPLMSDAKKESDRTIDMALQVSNKFEYNRACGCVINDIIINFVKSAGFAEKSPIDQMNAICDRFSSKINSEICRVQPPGETLRLTERLQQAHTYYYKKVKEEMKPDAIWIDDQMRERTGVAQAQTESMQIRTMIEASGDMSRIDEREIKQEFIKKVETETHFHAVLPPAVLAPSILKALGTALGVSSDIFKACEPENACLLYVKPEEVIDLYEPGKKLLDGDSAKCSRPFSLICTAICYAIFAHGVKEVCTDS